MLLGGQEIATAKKMKRNEVIEFDFNHHSMLEIVGETKGAIQFNKFEVLSCQSMPGINADGTTTTVGKRTTTAGKRTTTARRTTTAGKTTTVGKRTTTAGKRTTTAGRTTTAKRTTTTGRTRN